MKFEESRLGDIHHVHVVASGHPGKCTGSGCCSSPEAEAIPRLPAVDLKKRIIWDAQCREPEGRGLAFGGQDQEAGEPAGLTRIWRSGGWELLEESKADRARGPLEAETLKIAEAVKRQRRQYFQGKEVAEDDKQAKIDLLRAFTKLKPDKESTDKLVELKERLENDLNGDVKAPRLSLADVLNHLEAIRDLSATSPTLRALAAIAYDPKSGLYVMFGGDHLDYLMNDTWIFDPIRKRWEQPRAQIGPAAARQS